MQKWIGIRVSAVLALLGSAVTLLLGVLMTWIALRPGQLDNPPESPIPIKAVMGVMALLFTAFSVWGVASAIGIFWRRGWARLSMIVFACLLVGMGGSALVGILFIRLPDNPNVPAQSMQNIRLAIAAFYGSMTVIGAWWLLLFNSKATKQYFTTLPPAPGARPLSVSIIGWYLLISALGTALCAILRMPGMLFGVVFTGWSTVAVYTIWTAVQIYLGTGLLQLQESARLGTIAWFGLMIGSSLTSGLLPGYASRMQTLQQAMPAFLRATPPPPGLEGTGGLVMMAALLMAIPVWFLVRRRAAFRN
jgi:hypothetical protein